MLRFIELAVAAVLDTFRAVATWLGELFTGGSMAEPGPLGISLGGWWLVGALAVLLVVLLFGLGRRRGRRARAGGLPEMMVSHGEISLGELDGVQPEASTGLFRAPPSASLELRLALSNLNPYPVQLIELAVRSRGDSLPLVAEAGAVVPPNGAVDVAAELTSVSGEAERVELYLFTSRLKGRTFRLSAPLEWEPWARRYRIRALDSSSELVSELASQERLRRDRQEFEAGRRRERRRALTRAARERADGFWRQFEEYRAARTERARAAAEQAEAVNALVGNAPDGQPGSEHTAAQPGSPDSQQATPQRAPSRPPDAPERSGRPELRFPDEF